MRARCGPLYNGRISVGGLGIVCGAIPFDDEPMEQE